MENYFNDLVTIRTVYNKYGSDYKDKLPKHYCFDYMEEMVKNWNVEHITKQMLVLLPYDVFTFNYPFIDHYGEEIYDFHEWSHERDAYIDNYLYPKYKK